MRTPIIITVLVIVVAIGATVYVKTRTSPAAPTQNSSTAPTTQTVEPNTILISDYTFSPMSMTAPVGTTITWKNSDIAKHTITADTETADFPASPFFGKGETYSHTFTKAGTYSYHCEPHPYMKATITIQ